MCNRLSLSYLLMLLKLLNMVVHCTFGKVDCAAILSLTRLTRLRPLQSRSCSLINSVLHWKSSYADHTQYEEQNTHGTDLELQLF